jgi:hypothetical protein
VSGVAAPEMRANADALLDEVPSGHIPDVLKGGVRNLQLGYSFGEILDLAAHHLVWIGEDKAVEAELRSGVTVRAILKERYGACGGESQNAKREVNRFRLWLADARWRIRKLRAQEKLRAKWRRTQAWRGDTPEMVM